MDEFMARPYFRSTLRELKELFLSNQNDVMVLSALLAELGHRDSAPAVSLRAEIQRRLDELNGNGTTRYDVQLGFGSRPEEPDRRTRPSSESWVRATSSVAADKGRTYVGAGRAICAALASSNDWSRWALRADHQSTFALSRRT